MMNILLPLALLAAPDAGALNKMSSRFAPVELKVDVSALPASERAVIGKLVQASRIVDALFLRQVWAGNSGLLLELMRDTSAAGKARLDYFLLNKGPWSRLDNEAAFVDGVGQKPHSATFYPSRATKEEIEAWHKVLPDAEKRAAQGFFTTIRRLPNGKLTSIPYSVEYQPELQQIATLLTQAADLTTQPSLKNYLTTRATALLSNDYYASDVAWMELDASVEPTIGPYEVYEDGWFNAKAAFESFVTVRDDAETAKLAKLSGELQGLENELPIDAKYRNPKLGALAPIRVVNSVFGAGDANRGVQTAAFNLPNDERVTKEKGAKRVMLKNVQEAKFAKVLTPIAKIALASNDRSRVAFDAFFTHILMHELMHGLGPHDIQVNGKASTVRAELKELYSPIEEAKADVSGLWAMQKLIDKGALPKELERTMYVTYLASSFRSVRFGLSEAHGKGVAMQLNVLQDAGAFIVKGNAFTIDDTKIKDAVRDLTTKLMTIQATGDRAAAAALLEKQAVIRPEVKKVLDQLAAVPVDIAPKFVTAEKLVAEATPK
ncbi:MAG: hypothetical protein ACAI38_09270 [Myxococcota bacterium]